MNRLKRHFSVGLLAAAAAGITWVSASEVVILYPATIDGTLNLPTETVTNISAEFYPVAGGNASTKSTPASGPGPHDFDLTVDGGDPADPEDAGVSYRPSVYAYLQNPTASSSYLRIYRNTPILVNNTPEEPSTTFPVSFSYPMTHHADATISVVGGKLSSFSLSASASSSTANESYNAYTSGSGGLQASKTTWVPMIPSANVNVSGTAYVVNDQGIASSRPLASQTVNLSGGNQPVSWTIELLNDTGTLEGNVAIAMPSSSTATPTSYQIYYTGTSASTSGISGSVTANLNNDPHYSATLTPGEYRVYLRATFSNPQQNSETEYVQVTVPTNGATTLNFNDELGVARLELDLDGFYSVSDLQTLQTSLRASGGRNATNYQGPATTIDHTVSLGTWSMDRTYLRIVDSSNSELPVNNTMYRYHYTDPDFPPAEVTASGVVELGTEKITLVRSNVYFDIAETPAEKAANVVRKLSSPRIDAYKYDYNGSQLRRQSSVSAIGSGAETDVSGFTMVAEPGTYTLDARAYVNGTLTPFSASSITFGEPVDTPSGEDIEIELPKEPRPDLKVTVAFETVTGGGITTVVETPLGPEPPEGLRTVCKDLLAPDAPEKCPRMYYDITTDADWDKTKGAKVCIRRLFSSAQVEDEYAGYFLTLAHYEGGEWHDLVPSTVSNCATEPAACGCPSGGCTIPSDSVMFQVCATTHGFSPFAIFQRTPMLTNKIGDVEFTGRNGPGLQQWVVPVSGTYRVTAVGAQGGAATSTPARKGGCGAEVSGDFVLYEGEILEVLVGQKGTATADSGGGGGGTFVNKLGVPPLVIAGGGGGVRSGALVNGRSGTLSSNGTAGSLSLDYSGNFVEGGTSGAGGSFAPGHGTGGGGMWGNGGSDPAYGEGGFAFFDDAQGRGGAGVACGPAADGGYGGGGAGNGCHGGGGGGGYSGGGGGAIGGGGGSYNSGANPAGYEGRCTSTGHGSVTIDLIAGAP